MQRTIFLLLLAIGHSLVYGQTMTYSIEQKVTNKTPRFRVLGENRDGIVLRRYGKTSTILDVFDKNLDLKYSVPVNPRRQSAYVRSVILNPNGATVFLIDQQKNYSILFARILSDNLSKASRDIPIDTIFDNRDLIYSNLRYKLSQDKSKMMFYYPYVKNEEVQKIRVIVLENDLNRLASREFNVSGDNGNNQQIYSLLSNDGKAYFFAGQKIEDKRSEENLGKLTLYAIQGPGGKLRKFEIDLKEKLFDEPSFEFDNKNQQIAISGFIREERRRNKKASIGFYINYMDPETGTFNATLSTKFSSQFMFDLTGSDTAKTENKLYTFRIKDVVLRNDGGALIIAESFYKETDQVNLSSTVNPSFSSYRTYNVYYYNDIVAFSMSPDGELDWYSILRKKQISENDNGAFSSFCIMNERNRLRLLHLDEIYFRSNISEYVLDGNGNATRNVVLNQDEQEVMLIPKLAVQISPTEIVIPSLRKNLVSLVKITY